MQYRLFYGLAGPLRTIKWHKYMNGKESEKIALVCCGMRAFVDII
jgi:hypothetical protein